MDSGSPPSIRRSPPKSASKAILTRMGFKKTAHARLKGARTSISATPQKKR